MIIDWLFSGVSLILLLAAWFSFRRARQIENELLEKLHAVSSYTVSIDTNVKQAVARADAVIAEAERNMVTMRLAITKLDEFNRTY